MPLNAQGVWEYTEADNVSTFSGLLNLGQDAQTDKFASVAAQIETLENEIAEVPYSLVPLASGWSTTGGYAPMYIRKVGNTVELKGTVLQRTANLAVSPGVGYLVATLATAYRPVGNIRALAAGTMGIGGQLGASTVLLGNSGGLSAVCLMAPGTIASGGGWGNHVSIPSCSWFVSNA